MAEIKFDTRVALGIVAAERLAPPDRQSGETSVHRCPAADLFFEVASPALEGQAVIANESDENALGTSYKRHRLVGDPLHQRDRVDSAPDRILKARSINQQDRPLWESRRETRRPTVPKLRTSVDSLIDACAPDLSHLVPIMRVKRAGSCRPVVGSSCTTAAVCR